MKLDIGYDQSITMISREDWGSSPWDLVYIPPLNPPINRVRFTYTGQNYCTSDCVNKMQELLQFYTKNYRRTFLPFNFLVAGDGKVYEGGGWTLNVEKEGLGHSFLTGKTISIAFMGDFKKEGPPYKMQCLAMDLVKYGLKEKLIHPFFRSGHGEGSHHMDSDEQPNNSLTIK